MYCHYIGWCIGKCPLYRGVLYSECPLSEVPLYTCICVYGLVLDKPVVPGQLLFLELIETTHARHKFESEWIHR